MTISYGSYGLPFLMLVGLGAATACSPLAAPFSGMGSSQMTVYRLQNYEPQAGAAQAAPGGLQIPPQIQQWVQAGASLLPPGLVPPGLLGTAPAGQPGNSARFHNFRIIEWEPVNDPGVTRDILEVLGHGTNFQQATSNCMYAEFGLSIGQPNAPTPADVLVSLSCQQVQSFNFAWPYTQTGITQDAERKFVAIAQHVFAGR